MPLFHVQLERVPTLEIEAANSVEAETTAHGLAQNGYQRSNLVDDVTLPDDESVWLVFNIEEQP